MEPVVYVRNASDAKVYMKSADSKKHSPSVSTEILDVCSLQRQPSATSSLHHPHQQHPQQPSRPSMLKHSDSTFSLVPKHLGPASRVTDDSQVWACEHILRVVIYILVVLTCPVSFCFCFKIVAQYRRVVVFRLGRLMSSTARGPGLVFVLPCLDSVKFVDLRCCTFDVPTQEVLTKDSVSAAVDAVVYYRIEDPVMSIVNVEDSSRSTRSLAQTTLRNVLGTVKLYQLLSAREEIAVKMQECLDSATASWGIHVERVEIKDVRLPVQMQRAMAAEAEAVREASAKVIAAEGEHRASKALKAAAKEISDYPVALQLRYLQTLATISVDKNSTIIFPVPIDMMFRLFTAGGKPGIEDGSDTDIFPLPSSPSTSNSERSNPDCNSVVTNQNNLTAPSVLIQPCLTPKQKRAPPITPIPSPRSTAAKSLSGAISPVSLRGCLTSDSRKHRSIQVNLTNHDVTLS